MNLFYEWIWQKGIRGFLIMCERILVYILDNIHEYINNYKRISIYDKIFTLLAYVKKWSFFKMFFLRGFMPRDTYFGVSLPGLIFSYKSYILSEIARFLPLLVIYPLYPLPTQFWRKKEFLFFTQPNLNLPTQLYTPVLNLKIAVYR